MNETTYSKNQNKSSKKNPSKTTSDSTTPLQSEPTQNTPKKRYLVASRRGSVATLSGVQPLSSFELKEHIRRFSDVDVKKTIARKNGLSPQSRTMNEAHECHVVEMTDETHNELKANSPAHVIIEEEQHLDFLDGNLIPTMLPARAQSLDKILQEQTFTFVILGEDDKPLENVIVALQASHGKGNTLSDKKGEASITLPMMKNSQVDSIFVKAKTGYWDFYLKSPSLTTDSPNIIRLKSLTETIPDFPKNFRRGWGERLMGFDEQHNSYTGKGIKIAIIDTGLGEHPLLSHIQHGMDLSTANSTETWRQDDEGHGTHVAGVITAKGNADEMTGFCPEAEILILKVFPGGTTSSLIEALDICIDENVDVVNMSLGTQNISLLIEQKIEEVVLSGIALIVAAGNSGGPVQFPANSANTLAVSAVGAINEVEENTWDVSQILPELTLENGVFSPKFSCHGPEVDVTAPGVAIISTGPGGTYFPDSGTSMAAPHVTGLAGLLLAHHPMFQTTYKAKTYNRVFALYNALKQICVPYNFGPGRAGSGMPSVYPIMQYMGTTDQQVTN